MPNLARRKSDAARAAAADRRTEPLASPATTEEAIRGRAYQLYQSRGAVPGRDWDDWLQAERELRPSDADA